MNSNTLPKDSITISKNIEEISRKITDLLDQHAIEIRDDLMKNIMKEYEDIDTKLINDSAAEIIKQDQKKCNSKITPFINEFTYNVRLNFLNKICELYEIDFNLINSKYIKKPIISKLHNSRNEEPLVISENVKLYTRIMIDGKPMYLDEKTNTIYNQLNENVGSIQNNKYVLNSK